MTQELQTKEQKPDKQQTSRGEKLFDWMTYGGLAGVGVFIGTAMLTYWAKYGSGSRFQTWMIDGLTKRGMNKHSAEIIYNTTVTGSIGNAAIVPIKILENNKTEIVGKLNENLGETVDDDAVKHKPRQTWGSLIKSRVAAYIAVWSGFQGTATLVGGENFKAFEDKFAKNIVCNPLGRPTHTLVNGIAQETKTFRYGKVVALDVFASTAAASLLYVGSRLFARQEKKNLVGLIGEELDVLPPENGNGKDNGHTHAHTENTPAFAAKLNKTDNFVQRAQEAPTTLQPAQLG